MTTVLIISAVLSGIATLFLIAPIMQTRPRTGYFLMVFIPATSLLILFMITPIDLSPPPLADSYAQEEKSLKENLVQKPDNATIILDLAGLYIAQEKFDQAISLLRDAQRKAPDNDDYALQLAAAHFAKGLLYAENGEYEQGLKSLYYALAEAPENAPFLPDIEHFIDQLEKKVAGELRMTISP